MKGLKRLVAGVFVLLLVLTISATPTSAWSGSATFSPYTTYQGKSTNFTFRLYNNGSSWLTVNWIWIHFGWLDANLGYYFKANDGTVVSIAAGASYDFSTSIFVSGSALGTYSVEAQINAMASGDWWATTSTWTGSVYVVRALGAPTLSSPSSGSTTSSTTPTFSWYSVSGADYYQIQVDDSSYFTSTAIDTTTYSTSYTTYSYYALTAGKTYYWRVRGYNFTTGYGDWSSTRSFTIYPSVTITFYDLDTKQPIKYEFIYISTNYGSSWFYWGETDYYGKVTDASCEYAGKTIYFKIGEGNEYDIKSTYISTYGGSASVDVPPNSATRIRRLLPYIVLAIIVIGGVAGGVAYWVKKRKPLKKHEPRARPLKHRARAPPKDETIAYIPVECPKCGAANFPHAKHCTKCGRKLK